MAEFTSEYIDLCRKAALPREWQFGDWFLRTSHDPPLVRLVTSTPFALADEWSVWLPTEGDLLDLLEAEDITCVLFADNNAEGTEKIAYMGAAYLGLIRGRNIVTERALEEIPHGVGPDRKTALLRLLLAVRGIPEGDRG